MAIELTLADVAALIRTRTKLPNGTYAGTFTEETRPTDEEAEVLMARAIRQIRGRTNSSDDDEICNEGLVGSATDMAATYAAMLIELSYYPEQIGETNSPYDELKALYDQGMKALLEGISEICGEGGDGDSVGGQGPLPQYNFEASTRALGREINW